MGLIHRDSGAGWATVLDEHPPGAPAAATTTSPGQGQPTADGGTVDARYQGALHEGGVTMSDPVVDDDEILLHMVETQIFLTTQIEEALAALKSSDTETFSDAVSDLWEKCEWAWGAWEGALGELNHWRLQHRPDGDEND